MARPGGHSDNAGVTDAGTVAMDDAEKVLLLAGAAAAEPYVRRTPPAARWFMVGLVLGIVLTCYYAWLRYRQADARGDYPGTPL